MKKTVRLLFSLVLIGLLMVCMAACSRPEMEVDPWENATYTENTILGTGSKMVLVEVIVGEHSVSFTVKTDKITLEDALTEHQLISGDRDTYGLYVKTVNGIRADYTKDQSYWSLCKSGEALQAGVSAIQVADGEHYELVYTKAE